MENVLFKISFPAEFHAQTAVEAAIKLLAPDFQVFAVDLRGQGRSSRTPGRYTLDNMGNDLVRFASLVIPSAPS